MVSSILCSYAHPRKKVTFFFFFFTLFCFMRSPQTFYFFHIILFYEITTNRSQTVTINQFFFSIYIDIHTLMHTTVHKQITRVFQAVHKLSQWPQVFPPLSVHAQSCAQSWPITRIFQLFQLFTDHHGRSHAFFFSLSVTNIHAAIQVCSNSSNVHKSSWCTTSSPPTPPRIYQHMQPITNSPG